MFLGFSDTAFLRICLSFIALKSLNFLRLLIYISNFFLKNVSLSLPIASINKFDRLFYFY